MSRIDSAIMQFMNAKSSVLHLSVFCGVIFAFYFNITFNFNVPKIYLKRSLMYFLIISFVDYVVHFSISQVLKILD